MTNSEAQQEFLTDFIILLQKCEEKVVEGYISKFRIGEVWRRKSTQEWLVKKGWSRTLKSNHLNLRAGDLLFWKNGKRVTNISKKNKDGKWIGAAKVEEIGKFWESLSPYNRYGGFYTSFSDVSHFETLLRPR